MGGSSDGPGNSESTDQARASTLSASDYSTKNWNGGGVQLNASGRAKMGYSEYGSDGGGGGGGGGGCGGSYNPSGMNVQTNNPGNKPNFGYITNFLSESQSTEFREGERRDQDRTKGEGAFGDKAFISQFGKPEFGDTTTLSGASPFGEDKRGRFLKGEGKGYASEFASDASVPQQQGSATPGGEIGEGAQGFGARALGGSDQVVENLPPPGAEQTETPVAQAQSDLQLDPNIPPLGPGQSIIPDVNYVLPTTGQGQIIAFSPNDPQAMYTARGPLSRNLTTARTGFGMKYT